MIITILENSSKYDLSNSQENTHRRFHFSKFGCYKPTNLLKINSMTFFNFFSNLANFFGIHIKDNSCWIAQNILNKEVKEALHRRGWEAGVAIAKLYCRYFHNILNEFYLNGVSIDRCQVWWLLVLERRLRYKAVVPILKPWILKEGEILNKWRLSM